MKKRIAIGTGIFLLVLVGLLAGGSIYMINFSLRPENRGKDMEGSFTFMREKYPQIIPWVDSLQNHHALRDTFIISPDGIRMHAFYARAMKPPRIRQLSYMDIQTTLSACFTSVICITIH